LKCEEAALEKIAPGSGGARQLLRADNFVNFRDTIEAFEFEKADFARGDLGLDYFCAIRAWSKFPFQGVCLNLRGAKPVNVVADGCIIDAFAAAGIAHEGVAGMHADACAQWRAALLRFKLDDFGLQFQAALQAMNAGAAAQRGRSKLRRLSRRSVSRSSRHFCELPRSLAQSNHSEA